MAIDRFVADLHDTMTAFRCAGTGRLIRSGVSMTHMQVLWLLQHQGDLPMSHLAELLGVSVSNATGLIDRMEERGLVERVRVPDDRRVVLVRIGAGGIAAMDETEAVKQDRMRSILARLDPVQLDRLTTAFADLRTAIAAEFGDDLLTAHSHH
ncbi:MAG TPA: MarR family transcriptional regulator [Candidatus Limnocylindrales bacterium]|nr:MarR family transcriptional regulator [Candidatus Limnocylindrales bacterium]